MLFHFYAPHLLSSCLLYTCKHEWILGERKREIKRWNRMDRVCFHRDKREHCGDYRLPWLTMFFISHGSRCYRRFFIRDRKYTSCHVKNQMWRAVYRPQPHHTYCSPAGVPIISPALIPSAVS